MVPGLSDHCGFRYTRENFSLIAHSQMKLCLFKVAKLDACIRPLFANPVTFIDIAIIEAYHIEMGQHCDVSMYRNTLWFNMIDTAS